MNRKKKLQKKFYLEKLMLSAQLKKYKNAKMKAIK